MIKFAFSPYKWEEEDDKWPNEDGTILRIYGHTKNSKSVLVTVTDFSPYVYIELPEELPWSDYTIGAVKDKVRSICENNKKIGNPVELKFVMKKRLYGANVIKKGGKNVKRKYPHIFVSFPSKKSVYNLYYSLKKSLTIPGMGKVDFTLQEKGAKPDLQMRSLMNLNASGWNEGYGVRNTGENKESTCDYEFICSCKDLKPINDCFIIPNPKIVIIDGEMFSKNPNAVPDADNPEDKSFQWSIVSFRRGDEKEKWRKILLTLGSPKGSEMKGIEVRAFKTEVDLLIGLKDVILETNPAIIVGYNILKFDIPYLIKRAEMHQVLTSDICKMGCIESATGKITDIKWSSSAYGKQEFQFLDLSGRLFIDMYPLIQRTYKFSVYTLKVVAAELLGHTKDPLTHQGIFKCYRMGVQNPKSKNTDEGRKALAICGKYCVVDSVVTGELFVKTFTWVGLREESTVLNVPIIYIYTKGQQIRMYSQVYKLALHDDFVVQDNGYVSKGDYYSGAHVLDPVAGLHENVIPFDFCLAGDTKVSLSNNTSKKIDMMMDDVNVLGYEENGLSNYSTINGLELMGKKPTVTVYLQDGRTIQCTPDHKFMLDNGEWEEADNLKDKYVKCGVGYTEDKKYDDERNWDLEVEGYNLNMRTEDEREKSLAFSRIIGFILSDGCIYISSEYNTERSEAYFGTNIDAKNFKNDINLFCHNDISIRKRSGSKGTCYTLNIPIKVSRMIHSLEGIVSGKRSLQSMKLPSFVLDEKCPKAIVREFLGGLYGGDGTAPHISRSSNSFCAMSFKWTTIEKYKDNMVEVFNQLSMLHKKLGINITIYDPVLVKYKNKTFIPKDIIENSRYDIICRIKQDDTKTFFEEIGFRYCINKSCKLYIAYLYELMKYKTRAQHSFVIKRTNELIKEKINNTLSRNRGTSFSDCLEIARSELLNKEPVINIYSLSSVKDIGYQRGEEKRHKNRRRQLSLQSKKFPNSRKFMDDLNVKDWFSSSTTKHIYAVKSDDDTIPTFRQKVIDVRKAGLQEVYDIEVDTANSFLSEGVVSHNCSLYPTTIISSNISWDTFVQDYLSYRSHIPDEDCIIFDWTDHIGCKHDKTKRPQSKKKGKEKIICGHFRFRWLKTHVGLLCKMLTSLLESRSAIKKDIKVLKKELKGVKEENDTKNKEKIKDIELKLVVLDKRQWSLKISANSAYGALGVKEGYLPLLPGAMCTTSGGRKHLEKAIDIMEKKYNGQVVYGDSVTGDTPILCRYKGKIFYKTIDNLGVDNWTNYHTDKEEKKCPFEVWTEKGFTKINRVIRHENKKRIFRIITHHGRVDVTEDHSLLYEDGTKVTPNELKIGTSLMHSDFPSSKDGEFIFNKDGHLTLLASSFYELSSKGFNPSIDEYGKLNQKKGQRKHPNKIKKIISLGIIPGYVYDLETENHHFSAGVGRMIVHNTDSTMVKFPGFTDSEKLWNYALKVEEEISDMFPKPMALAFEKKIYKQMLLLTKKRYIIMVCGPDGVVYNKDSKGVLLNRRDNSKFVRTAYRKILDEICSYKTKDQVVDTIITIINELFMRLSVDISNFIITKKVNDIEAYKVKKLPENDEKELDRLFKLKKCDNEETYKIRCLPAHVQLAVNMRKRGMRVDPGSRLEYAITTRGDYDGKQWEKIEDPKYIERYSDIIRLDPLYYLKKLVQPVDQVLGIVYKLDNFMLKLHRMRIQKHKINKDIEKMFSPVEKIGEVILII